MMSRKELSIPIKIENISELDETIEKASRLVELLTEAQQIISSFSFKK